MAEKTPSSLGNFIELAEKARRKIEDFIIKRDVNLSVIFSVVDTNSDNELSKGEFKLKMRGLIPGFEDNELDAIFRELDSNNDGKISYKEFIRTFSQVNCAFIMKRLRNLLKASSWTAEQIYNKFCVRDAIRIDEFKKLVKSLIEDIADFELESIFNDLDKMINKHKGRKEQITKEDFCLYFSFKDEKGQSTIDEIIDIEDIFKPLNTYIQRKNVSVVDLFKKYDKNHDEMLSAEELKFALKDFL
jgi:Ca2+-binding EF-hand superfamily protein